MTTVKPSEEDLKSLQVVARRLKESKAQANAAQKVVDAAKEYLMRWLKENRNIDVETLKIGDIVMVDQVIMVKIDQQSRFDEKEFLLIHPALYDEFKKPRPVKNFEELV